ncbi:MAG: HAMP domain-containing protein [Spirochaetales bacterium]|nr:HAMP domain-containing protein [Spirochaetales bacterium]
MKKKLFLRWLTFICLFLITSAFLSLVIINRKAVGDGLFKRGRVFENPSLVAVGPDGSMAVVDMSKKRLTVIDKDSKQIFTMSGDSESEDSFFIISDIFFDDNGDLYLINYLSDKQGHFTIEERVAVILAGSNSVDTIFSLEYDESHTQLVQRGLLQGLGRGNLGVSFYQLYENSIFMYNLDEAASSFEKRKILELDNAWRVVAEISTADFAQALFTDNFGNLWYIKDGQPSPVELELRHPWAVSGYGSKGLAVVDFFTESLIICDNYDGELQLTFKFSDFSDYPIYKLNTSNGTLAFVSGDGIYYKSGDDFKLVEEFYLNDSIFLLNIFTFISMILSPIFFIILIIYFYIKILNRHISIIVKQLLLFIPILVLLVYLISHLAISDFTKRYYDSSTDRFSQVVQIITSNIQGSQALVEGEYGSDSYLDLRKYLLESLNFCNDKWNQDLYFAVYRVIDEKLYGFMYLNDGVGTYFPFDYYDYEESIYRNAWRGEVVSEMDIDFQGQWLYALGPIYADGKVVGILEVGTDLSAFKKQNLKLIMNISLRVGLLSVVFILFLVVITYVMMLSLRKLRDGVDAVREGNLETTVKVYNRNDEIAQLARGFNYMTEYLKKYFDQIQTLTNSYRRFVPNQFLNYLGRECVSDIILGDQVQQEMSLLFADIRSFTTLSERMTPKENFNFLNKYLGLMGPEIRKHNGFIDKYIGDAIMALFPLTPDDAVKTAIQMLQTLDEYNKHREKKLRVPVGIGVGIHTGQLMLGILGENERLDGTVISDNVNLASRLEGLTKYFSTQILLSRQSYERLQSPDDYFIRYVGKVRVKGKNKAEGIYEVIYENKSESNRLKIETKKLFENAVYLYEDGALIKAEKIFRDIYRSNKKDRACVIYLKLISFYKKNENYMQNWDGAITLSEK